MDTMADAQQTESNPTNADDFDALPATVDEKPDVYSPELPEREKRVSKLTEKGQSWFFEKSDEYVYKLRSISDNLVPLLKFNPSECSSAELTDIEQKLKECFDNYEHFSDDYLNFLSRHNTQESALEQSNHALVRRSLADRVNDAKHDIFTELRSRATKPKSKRSDTHRSSSRHSRSSGSSCSTIIDKKIKAEAAKARLKFIKKEVELKRSAAAIQADMDELNAYKEVAVAEAELSVVKDEYESDTSGSEGGHSSLLRKYFDNDTRDTKPPLLNINAQEFAPAKSEPVLPKLDSYRAPSLRSSMRHKPPSVLPPDDSCDKHTGMSVHANTDTNNNSVKEQALQQNVFSDFARFWFKKDLITKVDPFDDKPEHYLAWKTSFKRVMTELQVEPTEELDLLVRWLGPNSSVEARNIRACHTHNPSEGCDVIWRRLEERYGAPSLVEASIRRKLDSVKRLDDRDVNGLYHLSDILNEIHALKGNGQFAELLAQFNTPVGVSPIVAKLPRRLQDKWTTRAFQYKQQHKNVHYPPFSVFLTFVTEMASMYNDPGFVYSQTRYFGQQPSGAPRRGPVSTNKLNVSDNTSTIPSSLQILDPSKECPLHHSRHSLNDCERFRKWRLDKRRAFLRQNRVCFKCCASADHQSAECTSHSPCKICKSTLHATAMHLCKKESKQGSSQETNAVHGGERPDVATMCTTLCGLRSSGRSCAKIVMARVFPNNRPEAAVTVYAILDEQSTHTLARPDLFDELAIDTDPIPYSLESCAGQTMLTGRRALGLCIQSIDSDVSYQLPSVIECEHIPNNRTEIPTPDVAMAYSHLKPIAQELNPLRSDVGIQLLIGRDLVEVYQVLDQITGPTGSPFAQRLSLGWVVVGDVCLGGRHRQNEVSAFKTHVQKDGRGSIFEPCEGTIQVKVLGPLQREPSATSDFIGDRVFHKDRNDDKVGMSVEDREFVSIMDKDFGKNTNGNWTAPLPFKTPRLYLPNNRSQVYRRAIGLDAGLRRNPQKLKLMVEFMANIFSSGAAEEAPPISDGHECWYIPIFCVTHPKKPGKVRAVFDSSLVYQGCSLNDALLSGPNLTNSLLGILLRFRKDRFAIAGDIQQMFYRFFVNDDHRDFLRFYWYQNNDPGLRLVEYRMTVHVFGNRPSPAVATYGLRRAVQGADKDVVHFVQKDFYVDDALTSRPSASETIDLMKRTQAVLALGGNIRLHKIVSNDKQVMDAFPAADLGKDIKDLSVGDDSMLLQHSLGLAWDLRSDSFVFTSPDSVVPFTRRGILSKVNSIFDPVGFLSPVTICGKMLLREMCPTGTDWDEPLSESFRDPWLKWTQSLDKLSSVRIPRMFIPESLSLIQDPEFLVFSDASEKAIAAAAYVKVNDHIGFVMGKSKLAPVSGHSIPRLELCGSVLATEIGEFVSDHLSIPPSTIQYFTDSRVVLGYIRNRTRRFYTYVSNRVSRIHSVSKPDQWNYVPSNLNPSDSATRGFIADVTNSLDTWLRGLTYLRRGDLDSSSEEKDFPLVDPDEDTEVRPEPTILKGEVTTSAMPTPILDRFSRFSTWNRLVSGVSTIRHIAGSYCGSTQCSGWHMCKLAKLASFGKDTEHLILRRVQDQAFPRELDALKSGSSLPRDSRVGSLSPYLDEAGLMRVGGRLNRLRNTLGLASTNPVIVPKGPVATLLIRHYHERVFHQGRTITEGSLRSNGFWVLGAKKAIQSLINSCVTCRKLRGTVEEQKMANLPDDRLTPGPPFSSVGMDVFGPWQVITRRTRGGAAHSKRWAVLFTCLTTRAIHIEVIEQMSSSCFINALRRFTALRGPVTVLRSDRGTNFVGCTDQLKIDAINVEDDKVQPHLYNTGTVWKFNPPHSSHMGGVWERMIGVTRRILDGMLLEENKKGLTHEVLCTLMAEVCSVVNSRPITAISSDPESPIILSPNILLTQKQGEVPPFSGEFTLKDIYSADWKHVQVLSDMFWKKWQQEYLNQLQGRRKWRSEKPNVKQGDVVLMKEKNLPRNEWPIGIVTEAIRSHDDDLVRKAVVRLNRDGKCVSYTRPISELVLLVDE